MVRIASGILAIVAGVLLCSTPGLAQPGAKTVKLGETIEVTLTEQSGSVCFMTRNGRVFTTALPVSLKAGQSLSISATVVGGKRQVALAIVDPTGKWIEQTPAWTRKSAQLKVEEVNANGIYRIVIQSDLIGPFSIRACLSDAELTTKELEDKQQQLEKDLEAVKKQIAEAKTKSIKNP